MSKIARVSFKILDLLIIFVMTFGAPMTVLADPSPTGATITTQLPDYPPGALVLMTGAGWVADESVNVVVTADDGSWMLDSTPLDPIADSAGAFTYEFQLPNWYVPTYTVAATGFTSGTATVTFTDANPSATLDQCDPPNGYNATAYNCAKSGATGWVNGNNDGVYFEGDSLPYRLVMDNLSLASHTVTIEWDTTKGDKHALDYITSFNRTMLAANPCDGVSGCSAFTTFPIPADPQVTGAGVTQVAGNFTLYGGTITAVSAYSYPTGTGFSGDKSARITITFIASVANPVLAWAGHIASRQDWGADNSAVAISGSPYHTRLIDLDGSGGNQDRSLSADAVIFPGSITIIKDATPNGSTSFGFTGSPSPLTNFSLVDDGSSANTKVFSNITNFQSYTVNESSIPPGWGFDSVSCSVTTPNGGSYTTSTTTVNIVMKEGENWTCTYLDSQRTGTLTVIKHVVNDNGGTATASEWSIHVKSGASEVSGSPQAGSESGTSYTLTGGTYNVSETGGPSGYTFTGFSGDCDSSGNVTVAAGQNKTCTLTNDDQTAHLKLVKTVTNNNGGTAVATDFTLSAAGPTPISGAGGAESDVSAGSYALSETSVAGYTAGTWSCVGGTQNGSNISLANGQSATCTIINDDQTAHLKLVKTVTNDNGGTAAATDFTLSASGPTPISGAGGAASDVSAGTYDLSETSLAGYTASAWSCVGGTQNGASVTLALGESAICTINNNDIPPQLHLRKIVVNDNGGTAVATDWTLSANGTGTNDLSGSTPVDSGTGLLADTWNLSESGPAGYAASAWVCVGGSQNGGSITVGIGQSATCTITNDDIAPKLHLRKIVVNDNGGTATATDWTLSASGPTSLSGSTPVDSGAGFSAGTYALSESGPAGYTAGAWVCVGGTQNGSDITVGIGGEATCTITNDDQTAHLKLIKVVDNDNGGTAVATDFTLSASGPTPISGAGGAESDVNAGNYDLSETSVDGYTAGSWSCEGGTQNGASVTLALGQSATCTINNNDQTAHLKLVKTVTNDNGGSAVATDFTLSASGPTPISGAGGAESDVNAGSYTLSETTLPGYTAGSWSCVGGTQNGASITLALGQSATCTINNNDQQAYITVVKVVHNDHGGAAAADDFNLTLEGSPVSSGVAVPVNPGTYTAEETLLSGYTFDGFSGDCDSSGDTTVALGESKTCTLTNSDIAPQLHLRKIVVNNNGGTATVADFTLTADGTNSNDLSGTSPVDSGVGLQADTWALSETSLAGYSASAWSCVGGTQNGSNITVGIGGSATCTITNDDIAPKLHLRKIVVNDNGGTATTANFTLTANGTGSNDLSGTSPVDSGADLQADTWALSETGPAGYSASDWVCEGGTQNGSNITVGIGGEATCTITNDDIAPKLTLIKTVINDNGGTATVADFPLFISGTPATSGTAYEQLANVQLTATETSQTGYAASAWGGDCAANGTITLLPGDNKTCTITNNDIAPKLTLVKTVINDNGGTKTVADFPLFINGTPATSGIAYVQSANVQLTATETSQTGYAASVWGGDCAADGTITLLPGDNKTCTITNNDIQPKLTLVKTVVNDNGGTKTVADFPLFVSGSSVTSGVANGFNAGSYTASETSQYGYTASAWGGDCAANGSVTLSVGDNKTCTITNNDQPGTIIVIKRIKPAGSSTSFSFSTTGDNGANALPDYAPFSLSADQQNSQTLDAGAYTVTELVPLGWVLTGLGGDSVDPYKCSVTGTGGSSGIAEFDINNQLTGKATIDLKNGDTVTCIFENTGQGATRTQGFWATHSQLADIAWFGGTAFGHTFPGVANVSGIGDTLICGRPLDDRGKLMGGFWSDISKKSTGAKRSSLDQARMQLLQQLLAAELNASAFGSVPTSGSFAAWESALCGTNQNAITTAKQQAASFNTFGDSTTFTPGTSADSRYGRSIANIPFWDIIKP